MSPSGRLGLGALFSASLLLSLWAPGCSARSTEAAADAGADAEALPVAAAVAAMVAATDAGTDAEADADAAMDAEADADASLPGTSEGCPDDMVLVHGDYCPDVQQTCLEHHSEFDHDQARKKARGTSAPSTVSERCMRYEEPSKCLSKKRQPMRYCMDRYEWPNKKGELPALLVSWQDAAKLCESRGKRLCTEAEFNFACEGEAMLPYTYGYVRDAEACNIDRPYRKREKKLFKYESCMKRPDCKAELEKLDQRLPTGSMPRCVSPFGVYDLNGNINEWVVRPNQKYPTRSGLKGGWWGPVRGRCRPTVGFHKEDDYGYEEGFRCCQDAASASP
jgi:hypothetical protein